LRKPKALVSGGVSNSLSTGRCGCGCEGLGLESALRVRDGVCEARCTDVDHQGYRGLLCGGGEVLQPVERGGLALLDPQVRQSVRKAARDHVVAFLAVERVCPLGTRVIRRARVGWDAEGERRSGLPLNGTKVFDHTHGRAGAASVALIPNGKAEVRGGPGVGPGVGPGARLPKNKK
jgi:hypothetical protein